MLDREQFDLLHFHEPFVPFLAVFLLRESRSVNIATFHAYSGYAPALRARAGSCLGRWPGPARADRGQRGGPALHRPLLPRRLQGDPERRRPGTASPTPSRSPAGRTAARTSCSSAASSPARACSRFSRRTGSCARAAASAGSWSSAPGRRSGRRAATSMTRRLPDVEFLGRVSDAEKVQLFKTADVFVSPATGRESFGIVLLEAMAAGTAIVCSDIHGYKGVVQAGRAGAPGAAGRVAPAGRGDPAAPRRPRPARADAAEPDWSAWSSSAGSGSRRRSRPTTGS